MNSKLKYLGLIFFIASIPFFMHAADDEMVEITIPGETQSYTPHEKDVISFVSVRGKADEMKQLTQNGSGLSNKKLLDKNLQEENYIEVLKQVWSEKDSAKKKAFLEAQANKGHPIFMLELGIENLRQNPSLENFIENAQPWLVAGIVRTQQDLTCVEDPTANSAIQTLMITYYREIDPLLQGKYTQEDAEEFMKNNEKQMMENVNKKVNQALDTNKPLPSPKWISYHGMKAADGDISLIPEDQWNKTRKDFANQILGNTDN